MPTANLINRRLLVDKIIKKGEIIMKALNENIVTTAEAVAASEDACMYCLKQELC